MKREADLRVPKNASMNKWSSARLSVLSGSFSANSAGSSSSSHFYSDKNLEDHMTSNSVYANLKQAIIFGCVHDPRMQSTPFCIIWSQKFVVDSRIRRYASCFQNRRLLEVYLSLAQDNEDIFAR